MIGVPRRECADALALGIVDHPFDVQSVPFRLVACTTSMVTNTIDPEIFVACSV